jgi:peptidoglycan/LPS O-acetylase OafA/YrhL
MSQEKPSAGFDEPRFKIDFVAARTSARLATSLARNHTELSQVNTPHSELPSWLGSGRIPSLDGLRAIAVFLVLLIHASRTRGFPDQAILKAISRRGYVGVDVFFVISGFLITILILRELDRTERLSIVRFFARRGLRIIPAYATLLLAVAALQAAGLAQLRGRDWLAAFTYTTNFIQHPAWEIGHSWSLSIEEHFYLVWPVLLAIAPRTGGVSALGCMGFCFAARWAILFLWPAQTQMAELWTFTRIDTIATGCLLAHLAWSERWRPYLDRYCANGNAVAATGLILTGSLAVSGYSGKFSVGIAYSLNAVCIALLAWAAMRRADTVVGRILNHRFLISVGVASYSLYLWQQLFLQPESTQPWCVFPLNLVLAVLVALLSYRMIERPFLFLKGRLDRRFWVKSRCDQVDFAAAHVL